MGGNVLVGVGVKWQCVGKGGVEWQCVGKGGVAMCW